MLWSGALIAGEIIMGMGYSCDGCAFHQRANIFCKKKNNKRANVVSEPSRIRSEFENDYVEIKQLASQFSELSRFAHDINEFGKEGNGQHAAMFFYQKSIRQAFVDEFEERLRALLGKKMSFADYWKTRSC